jgi:hypothetical protein
MRICPNLNDPAVAAKYNAIVNDPELGELEAMREFMQAENQSREIGTPEQVKQKIKDQYTEKSPEAIAQTDNEQKETILQSVVDPTMADPNSLTGIDYLTNPVTNFDLSTESTDNSRAIEVVGKFSQATGIPYAIVSPQEAIDATATSKNPIRNLAEATRKKAFFHQGTVYFIKGSLTTSMAFHEFSHPIARSLAIQNPQLFNKLVNDALVLDPTLLDAAMNEYADLREAIANETDEQAKQELKAKYEAVVKEEVLVKALTKSHELEAAGLRPDTKFAKFINDLLFAFKQLLRKTFGQKIDISKLSASTTVNQLADMLAKGGNFKIDTELVKDSDVVAYNNERQDFIDSLSLLKEQDLVKLSTQAFDIAKNQVRLFIENKNYKALAEILTDEYKRGDLQEIMNNLNKYSGDLVEKAEQLIADVEKTKNNVEALVNTMFRLEKVMSHIDSTLKELQKGEKTPQELKDNLQTAYYYKGVVEYWQEYIELARDTMEKAGVDKKSSMYNLLLKMNDTAQSASNSITNIYKEGTSEYLMEELSALRDGMDEEFESMISTLKKQKASKASIDKRYKEYYNLTEEEFNLMNQLRSRVDKGERLSTTESSELSMLERATMDGKSLTKEKINFLLEGQGKDANYINNFLEGYMYSTDPIIAGFTSYLKKNLGAVQVQAQTKANKFMTDIDDLVKKAGINFRVIGGYGKVLGFTDEVGGYDKDGNFIKKKRWAFLNKFKNNRFVIDEFDHNIKELKKAYEASKTDENKNKLTSMIAQKKKHLKEWFQQEFVDEFYQKDAIFNKEPNDIVGQEAINRRDDIFQRMRLIIEPLTTETDVLNADDRLAELWREYRLMHSMYDVEGNLKTNSFVDANGNTVITNNLAIAERLQEYKEASREFYEFKPRKGVFENALKKFEQETETKLLKEGYTGTYYDEEFAKRRAEWLKKNTVIKLKQAFYDTRAEILARINDILSKAKLTDKQKEELNFDKSWVTILDATSGFRDDNGQPLGNEISEGRRSEVKKAQQEMEKAKEKWAGYSGLTKQQMSDLQELFAKREQGDLEEDDLDKFYYLLKIKDKLGLTQAQRTDLNKAYSDLAKLQSKSPTEYYLEAVNNWFEKLDTEKIYKATGIKEITEDNIDLVFNKENLKTFFKDPNYGAEFKEWFDKNHYEKKYWDNEAKEEKTVNERLYVWSVIKPVNPDYYESTELKDQDGNVIGKIDGVPSLKYFARVVKKEYRNGYNKATGKVELKVGEHIDNKGNFLPKDLINSPYRNEEYYDLQKRDPAMFALLEKIKETFIEWQKGSPKNSKLYYDYPRYLKSDLEMAQTAFTKKPGEKVGLIQQIINRIREFFLGSRSDYDKGLNFKAQLKLVQTDMFDNAIDKIPVSGLSDYDEYETSTDVFTSMMRYMYGAEKQKKLIEINPLAQAIKSLLTDPNNQPKEADSINAGAFRNTGLIKFVNKKGSYIRQQQFQALYDREFRGANTTGWGSDSEILQNASNFMFKRAANAFFAINITSALKNAFGAKLQAIIMSSAGKYLTPRTYLKGEVWSARVMGKISMNVYKGPTTDVELLLAETMDFAQGRTEDKFGTRMTRTLGKDIVDRSWLVNVRKWTELQSTLAASAGMMYKEKVMMGNIEIPYIEAWEVKDGKLQLKPGIDPEYGIKYNDDGTVELGKKFIAMKNRIHMVNNKLIGAVSKFDQPDAKRYLAFRMVSFMKGYFTEMAVNRFAKNRMNVGLGGMDEGYYVTAVKSLLETIKEKNLAHMGPKEKEAFMQVFTEVATLFLVGMLSAMILGGFDPDDPDRYQKLREKTGPLHIPGVSEEEDPFNFGGFMQVHAGLLMMQIKAENEQLAFWHPKAVLAPFTDLKSIGFGPTLDSYFSAGTDIVNMFEGSDKAYYARRMGPYEWQQQGGAKLWSHIARMYGINASSIDPVTALKNFQTAQSLNLNR